MAERLTPALLGLALAAALPALAQTAGLTDPTRPLGERAQQRGAVLAAGEFDIRLRGENETPFFDD